MDTIHLTKATTIYVDADGGADYIKIQDAINASGYGDTVYVYNGIYEEYLTLKDGISLLGEMPNRPILDGTNLTPGPEGRLMIIPANETLIEGFIIQNADRGVLNRGIKNVHISRNSFMNINWTGIHNWDGATSNISNNLFINNDYAIASVEGSGGSSPSNDSIINNVFDSCYTAIYGPTGIQRIVNNIIVNSNKGLGNCNNAETYIGYNLFWNNSQNYDGSPAGENDTIADPKFEDNSYHLAWDSPAIDAGSPEYAPPNDFEGDIRPFDGDGDGLGEFDIGVDEKIDIDSPVITLISPLNNSIIRSGTILDFNVSDPFLNEVSYSENGGSFADLPAPYDIETTGWSDDPFEIEIYADDTHGHTVNRLYYFTVDSTKPTIILNSPSNNSVIIAGTVLDFDVTDAHLNISNYSVNSGGSAPFEPPYDIDTAGWSDDFYNISIHAIDEAGNIAEEIYGFTIDSSPPNITLNSPANGSIISKGTSLDFEITDLHLNEVSYSIGGGVKIDLPAPYDIDTIDWLDGNYTVEIHANDTPDNRAIKWFYFILDSTKPTISLVSLSNNTVITAGTVIDVDINDSHLNVTTFSINGASTQAFSAPYDIDTTGWSDDNYRIDIFASDLADNTNETWFNITIDSTPPDITLGSPLNNSFFNTDMEISFSVLDNNLKEVMYSVDGGSMISLDPPFTINTSSWSDGEYSITVLARDLAGNSNENWFGFTKDTTSPEIVLNSPDNGSLILQASLIDLDITDTNLDSVSYSLNQGSLMDINEPYDLDTSDWDDGDYTTNIRAEDLAGNIRENWFVFKIDTSPPSILSTEPDDGTSDISADAKVTIEFDESMDTESVESAISIIPYIEYVFLWHNENRTLILNFTSSLEYGTLYLISIDTKTKDMAGRELEDKYEFEFTTGAEPKEGDGGEFPVLFLLLAIIAIVAVVIIVFLVTAKKKKVSGEVIPAQVEVPQTIQVTCSSCNNLLSVNDIGMTMNVTCPFCSTTLTVQSQKPAPRQPQTQPVATLISCPRCKTSFPVMKSEGPTNIQCPSCGLTGKIG